MLAGDLADLAVQHVAQEAVFDVRPVHVGDDRRELPVALVGREALPRRSGRAAAEHGAVIGEPVPLGPVQRLAGRGAGAALADLLGTQRSEEHTSELQSLMRISYAVFCLKKKKKKPDY